MIGKSGARQEIQNYLSEIEYFIKRAREDANDDIPHWKEKALDHIRLTLHIIDTNDDSKVEPEESSYIGGLKFVFIRRGHGEEGAQISFTKEDVIFNLSFWTTKNDKSVSLSYDKDRGKISLFFRKDGESIYKEKYI